MTECQSKRPIGILILSVLFLVICGTLLTTIVIMLIHNADNHQARDGLSQIVIGGLVSLVVPTAAAGIGMWKGNKWGWYLGTFCLMYSIVRHINALLVIPLLMDSMRPEELPKMLRGSLYYIQHGSGVIIAFLFYLYLFKDHVRDFFALIGQNKWKPIIAELGISVGIAAFFNIAARAMEGW